MVTRRGFLEHVIYDAGVRRVVSVCLGALACLSFIGLSQVRAQESPTTTTAPTTTTTPRVDFTTTTASTVKTTTTVKTNATTTTTASNGGRPVPPPASGPTQTLVPDLVGTPVDISTTTTVGGFVPFSGSFTPTTFATDTESASTIVAHKNSPSGATLVLAAIAWLASFGGLLVYAEERRSTQWKHLAR